MKLRSVEAEILMFRTVLVPRLSRTLISFLICPLSGPGTSEFSIFKEPSFNCCNQSQYSAELQYFQSGGMCFISSLNDEEFELGRIRSGGVIIR